MIKLNGSVLGNLCSSASAVLSVLAYKFTNIHGNILSTAISVLCKRLPSYLGNNVYKPGSVESTYTFHYRNQFRQEV